MCAKTMVASSVPRMNRMWNVGVTSIDVVARMVSGRAIVSSLID